MEAVVMAAGEGTRLRPLTERWPKPVLPIDGRPVLAVLLRELAAANLRRVWLVTGHLAEQVEELLHGPGVRFVRQPRPHGSADAVRRALDDGAGLPAIVTAADTVFRPGDLARVAGAEGAAGAVAYRPDPRKARIAIDDGVVTQVVSRDESLPFSSAPVWLLTEEIDLAGLAGPPFELSEAFQRAIDAGKRVAAVEIGPTRDLTTPIDLARENFPYLAT
jgi:UDP-N-acetylglucosamine diphosphorylase / glucose-1-phosphate thymidylyltransferase / UDP-N-acetylgalactosamine diphosphorylase / glucosamine-1-phosphate N-acetyltransferase / galactosamine-1-phosphate N-acetyltransferase